MEAHSDSVYKNIILKALDFSWHHKKLWFLGVFAGFVNAGGVFEVLVRGLRDVMGDSFSWETVANAIAPGGSLLLLIPDMVTNNNLSPAAATALWLTTIGLVTGAFWFFSLAQGTLLAAVNNPGDVSLSKRTYEELPYAWRLVGANFITHLALAGIMLLTFYPYARAMNAVGQAAATGLGFLIATPLTIFVTVASILTACGIALHKQSLKQAWQNAFVAIKKQPLLLAEASLVLFVLSVLFVMVLVAALRMLAYVFSVYNFVGFLISLGAISGLLGTALVALSLLVILAAFGFLVTFQYAAWAALYERVLFGQARAALHRYVLHPLKMRFAR